MEETGCEVICSAPTTLAVKGLMVKVKIVKKHLVSAATALLLLPLANHWQTTGKPLANHWQTTFARRFKY